MRVKCVDEAAAAVLNAISYYEQQQPKLENAEACRLRANGYRRLNLRIFPYYIPYIIRGSTLWVIAVAHSRREPE